MEMNSVLTSWKEIASYLGKGVRTVQRWEVEMGLPVHRPGKDRHVVIAYSRELDEWIRKVPANKTKEIAGRAGENTERCKLLLQQQRLLLHRDKLRKMRELVKAMIESTVRTRNNAAMVKQSCQRAMERRNSNAHGAGAA